MTPALHAEQAGAGTPEGDSHAAAGAADQAPPAAAGQALRTIDGETKAQRYLARLRADRAAPDELALAVAPLYGAELRGFCSTLRKALESQGQLDAVRRAVTAHHLALDCREHGGIAAGRAIDAIEQALGMPWVQGKALEGNHA